MVCEATSHTNAQQRSSFVAMIMIDTRAQTLQPCSEKAGVACASDSTKSEAGTKEGQVGGVGDVGGAE